MNGINEFSFVSTILPKEKLSCLKKLQNFDRLLLEILHEEVKHGNKILSVTDQGPEEAMAVLLSRPFKKKYDSTGLKFESSTNVHDSGDSYSTNHPKPFTLIAPLK